MIDKGLMPGWERHTFVCGTDKHIRCKERGCPLHTSKPKGHHCLFCADMGDF